MRTAWFVAGAVLAFASVSNAQDLGHKIPGTLGLHAGDQQDAGIHFAERFGFLDSHVARDRNGAVLPIGAFDLDASSAALGMSFAMPLPRDGPYFGATIAVPIGHISLDSQRPEVSTDRYGIGDIYVQPLHLGLHSTYADVVTGYGLYIPTGWYDPAGQHGIGVGHWTQEFSLGGSLYANAARTFFVSALASFDLNSVKRNIDIRRGATAQIQGGAGTRIARLVDVGMVGYALWQVTDDIGDDVPSVLRGARDRVFGVGPEIGVRVPPLGLFVSLRYTHDFGVLSRPEANLFFVGLNWMLRSLPPTPHTTFLGPPPEVASTRLR